MQLALDVARDRDVQRLYFVRCCESNHTIPFNALLNTHTETRDDPTPTGQRSSQQHGNHSMRTASADNNQRRHNDQFRDTGGPEADPTGHTARHQTSHVLPFLCTDSSPLTSPLKDLSGWQRYKSDQMLDIISHVTSGNFLTKAVQTLKKLDESNEARVEARYDGAQEVQTRRDD